MVYFAVCIFLSAFLLFQVEPMIAKYILPWFGGTPAVWSTVVLFFQVLLTGGYAYAAWLAGKARRREVVHLVLLGVSVLLMLILGFLWKSPITPCVSWKPRGGAFPVWEIFKLLMVSVGLPYFLLSSNSPLIQAWFNRAFPKKTAYRLYALSNVGSLLALVTYPVLIEPYLTLTWQGRLWSLAYAVYAGLAAYGAITVLRNRRPVQEPAPDQPAAYPKDKHPNPLPAAQDSGVVPSESTSYLQDKSPRPRDYILWVALAAIASILLLAVTSQITQEVAVVPFLWVLPLSIYLLTFILAFSGERWYSRQFFLLAFFVATLLCVWVLKNTATLKIPVQIGGYSLLLLASCMVCHGELYRLRPHPAHLTAFYLMVSVGGALGGIFIIFVAPYIFKGYWELILGLALCWLLFLLVTVLSRAQFLRHWQFVANSVLLLLGLVVTGTFAYQYIHADLVDSLYIQRNFFGIVRVRQRDFYAVIPIHVGAINQDIMSYHRYALIHGVTIHGYQFHDELLRDQPTSYYGKTSGIGLAILNHPNRSRGMRVGVLGLGVGTLAVYGQPGDVYRFYEINPVVIRLAEGERGYFSYLSDSQAKVEIIPGDARLSLETELATGLSQDYDVLVLDVFSSDSIPVHLLDSEAFALYLQHLKPEGILAVHISNSHLDLTPVVWTLADHFGLSRVLIDDSGDGIVTYPSIWVLLARDPALLANPAIASRAAPMVGYASHIRLWTDEYNNLFQILK